MSTYNAVPADVNPEVQLEDTLIKLDAAYKQVADELAALTSRIYTALDEIAEAAGAWHCMNCGEWTTGMVIIESHSDEMGYETTEGCPRCAEVS